MTTHDVKNCDASTRIADAALFTSVAENELAPKVREIDAGLYPKDVMHAFGTAGAYATHLPQSDTADLGTTINLMREAGALCTSTAFCMWCQNALAWYIHCSDNQWLKDNVGAQIASGEVLGGTGLSNPMKTFFGIEKMRLKATRVDGGYRVKGNLPWVSNVEDDGYFAVVFEVAGEDPPHRVMAVVKADAPGVRLTVDHDFMAMGGTATVAVALKDVLIEDKFILADPIDAYLKRIRAGFVLMQCGMALGMIESSIALMKSVQGPLGHVNKYLDEQPEDFEEKFKALRDEVETLAKTPFEPTMAYFRRVVRARLDGGEAAMSAAHNAMLHCGARGYIGRGEAQRRVREAYFIGIVTPATKQLKKMLAELPPAEETAA
ncbi:MAG: acyl-CoA dehydrogenase family protein [Pseudomonadota bacterium]